MATQPKSASPPNWLRMRARDLSSCALRHRLLADALEDEAWRLEKRAAEAERQTPEADGAAQ